MSIMDNLFDNQKSECQICHNDYLPSELAGCQDCSTTFCVDCETQHDSNCGKNSCVDCHKPIPISEPYVTIDDENYHVDCYGHTLGEIFQLVRKSPQFLHRDDIFLHPKLIDLSYSTVRNALTKLMKANLVKSIPCPVDQRTKHYYQRWQQLEVEVECPTKLDIANQRYENRREQLKGDN